jgi:hypothetical protein
VGFSTNAFGASTSHQEVAGADAGLTDSSAYQCVAAEAVEFADCISRLKLKKMRHKMEHREYESAPGSCIIEFETAECRHENDWNIKRMLNCLESCFDAGTVTLENVEIDLAVFSGDKAEREAPNGCADGKVVKLET